MRDPELRALLQAVQHGALSVDQALSSLRPSAAPAQAGGSEFDRIVELQRLFGPTSAAVQLGIGDDAALLHPHTKPWVLSVDAAVESVHFERSFASWSELGMRAFSAAVSDLAAMASTPVAALSSLIAPSDFPADAFRELNSGIARGAAAYGCPVIGGNLSAGRELSITTTVIGSLPARPLLRSGAQPGDHIYVTGPLGSAALGLLLLQRGAAERGPRFVEAWRRPEARLREGQTIAGHATAAIDVSDGALQDLGHICAASQLGAQLEAARLPFAPGFETLARELGADPLALALLGGEDYELIYTWPADVEETGPGTYIGKISLLPGAPQVLDAQGQIVTPSGWGYRHF
jgi:thiamine-monophosphate kinase